MPHWLSLVLALLPGVVIVVSGLRTMRRRTQANLSNPGLSVLLARPGC